MFSPRTTLGHNNHEARTQTSTTQPALTGQVSFLHPQQDKENFLTCPLSVRKHMDETDSSESDCMIVELDTPPVSEVKNRTGKRIDTHAVVSSLAARGFVDLWHTTHFFAGASHTDTCLRKSNTGRLSRLAGHQSSRRATYHGRIHSRHIAMFLGSDK